LEGSTQWSVEFLNGVVKEEFRGLPKDMRAMGKAGISRGIYVAITGRRVVILRIFVKKTQKTPRSEILLALDRMKEL
jgi:phage-related protein